MSIYFLLLKRYFWR